MLHIISWRVSTALQAAAVSSIYSCPITESPELVRQDCCGRQMCVIVYCVYKYVYVTNAWCILCGCLTAVHVIVLGFWSVCDFAAWFLRSCDAVFHGVLTCKRILLLISSLKPYMGCNEYVAKANLKMYWYTLKFTFKIVKSHIYKFWMIYVKSFIVYGGCSVFGSTEVMYRPTEVILAVYYCVSLKVVWSRCVHCTR